MILIDMKMPKNCVTCPFFVEDSWCSVQKGGPAVWVCKSNRSVNCPLVELPPHGRLIDADALEASCFMGSSSFYTQSDIDYAPTIIPAEEGE